MAHRRARSSGITADDGGRLRTTAPPTISAACYNLPLSPLSEAFGGIQWEALSHRLAMPSAASSAFGDAPALTTGQCSLLRSSEANPMEYTLAVFDEAHTLCRTLLHVLELITLQCGSATSTSTSTAATTTGATTTAAATGRNSHHRPTSPTTDGMPVTTSWDQDEQVLLDEEDALQVYYEQPLTVITHFVISQLYDFLRCLLESSMSSSISERGKNNVTVAEQSTNQPRLDLLSSTPTTTSSTASPRKRLLFETQNPKQHCTIWDYFYDPTDGSLLEDWRPLLKILYKTVGGSAAYIDTFISRGASLCLAYILRAGCPSFQTISQQKLLGSSPSASSSLPSEEALQALIGWIASRLQSASANKYGSNGHTAAIYASTNVRIVTPAFMVLSTCHECRIFLDQAGGVGYLVRHIRSMVQSGRGTVQTLQRTSSRDASEADGGTDFRRGSSATFTMKHHIVSTSTTAATAGAVSGGTSTASVPGTGPVGNSPYRDKPSVSRLSSSFRAADVLSSTISLPSAVTLTGMATTTTTTTTTAATTTATTRSTQHIKKRMTIYSTSAQQLYELVFCLWTMTYECCVSALSQEDASSASRPQHQILRNFQRNHAIFVLCDVVANAPREKITRLGLNALRNLAATANMTTAAATPTTAAKRNEFDDQLFLSFSNTSIGDDDDDDNDRTHYSSNPPPFLREMIGYGFHRTLTLLKERTAATTADPDMLEDLQHLLQLIESSYKDMTKFQLYQAEVATTKLRWGVLHKQQFFQQNARSMERNNFQVVKQLIGILKKYTRRYLQFIPTASGTFIDRRQHPHQTDMSTFFQASTTDVSYNRFVAEDRTRSKFCNGVSNIGGRSKSKGSDSSNSKSNSKSIRKSIYRDGGGDDNDDSNGGGDDDDEDKEEGTSTAAIACYDLGEFVRFYPNGRQIVNQFGLKPLILCLIHSEDEELQHQALVCLSKLLLSSSRRMK